MRAWSGVNSVGYDRTCLGGEAMDWDSAVQRELYRLKVEKVDELKEKAKQVDELKEKAKQVDELKEKAKQVDELKETNREYDLNNLEKVATSSMSNSEDDTTKILVFGFDGSQRTVKSC